MFFAPEDDGPSRPDHRRPRGHPEPPCAGAAAEWRPYDPTASSAGVTPASSPFLSAQQQRTAAFIDARKPFACQKEADQEADTHHPDAPGADGADAGSANAALVEHLQGLRDVYKASGDKWREYAYNKAANMIKKLPQRVESADELRHKYGFGERILNKIDEFLKTGTTRKYQHLTSTPEAHALDELTKVWGVGPTTARKLFQLGATGVEVLRSTPDLKAHLTSAQLVGLAHYDDLLHRIPRPEVAAIEGVVRATIACVGFVPRSPDAEEQSVQTEAPSSAVRARREMDVLTCGSYRRGRPNSGDVDVLLCDRTGRHDQGILTLVVNRMVENAGKPAAEAAGQTAGDRFDLVEKLTRGSRSSEESHSDTWFGVVRLPRCGGEAGPNPECSFAHRVDGTHYARRLDLKVYPAAQYPFAVLYFTGSDYFNRSMRLYAQKKGLSLSDKALQPVVRVRGDKVHEGSEVPCHTERDIFDALGLPYKLPTQRDIA